MKAQLPTGEAVTEKAQSPDHYPARGPDMATRTLD